MYNEDTLIGIAKRENNKKRNFLVVNRLQGKHVPVKPGVAMNMFRALAKKVKEAYVGEKLLLVGFAETATAIGAALAAELDCYYIQTTREDMGQLEYIYFTESHSHATEQKLVKKDMLDCFTKVDRVVFVEDEVTTGNTIQKIVDIIKNEYASDMKFGVASLINGMNAENEAKYVANQIDVFYLVKTNNDKYIDVAEKYAGDGTFHLLNTTVSESPIEAVCNKSYVNARRVTESSRYKEACKELFETVKDKISFSPEKSVLVLGTEEFMYPALFVAEEIEKSGVEVKFHATTRSPIIVSSEKEYPLHKRFELRSLYDDERVTYIYDLDVYDQVVIITDADGSKQKGIKSLLSALEESGNKNIHVIRWTDK